MGIDLYLKTRKNCVFPTSDILFESNNVTPAYGRSGRIMVVIPVKSLYSVSFTVSQSVSV